MHYAMQCWQERIEQINDEFANRFNSLNREIGEKILNTKNFASILQSARMNAAMDPDADKIPLYVSSVLNAVENENIDDTKIHIFLNILRDITTLHLNLLRRLASPIHASPTSGFQKVVGARLRDTEDVIAEKFFPDIKHEELINIALSDLYKYGLISVGSLEHIGHREECIQNQITVLGNEFLAFIKSS